MAYLGRITPVVSVTSDEITDGTILNADINASAAIAKTKLASLAIVNSDVDGSAAIAKSKLASLDIVNADVNASAAIALSKLATDPSNASNLASGTVPTARLGSGTASSSTFLRGDQTYAAAGGGKIAQVVVGTHTESGGQTVTTSGFVDTTLNATITPAATSSKILLMMVGSSWDDAAADSRGLETKLYKSVGGAADAAIDASLTKTHNAGGIQGKNPYSLVYVDSPSTTSAIEYSIYVKAIGSTVYYFEDAMTYQLVAMEISA